MSRMVGTVSMGIRAPIIRSGDDLVEITCDETGPAIAYVFKTIADPFVGKMSFFKVLSGKLTSDMAPNNSRTGAPEKMSKLLFLRGKKQEDCDGIGAGEAVSAATRKRDQILKDIQDKTRASVANVLDSLVGTGNYRVSVMPDLDLSTIDETQEHYGDAPKINREESVLDSDTNQVAMGVPGSLSNRPPIAARDDQRYGRKPLAGSAFQTQRK